MLHYVQREAKHTEKEERYENLSSEGPELLRSHPNPYSTSHVINPRIQPGCGTGLASSRSDGRKIEWLDCYQ